MPINVRSTAVSLAVLSFFFLSSVSAFCGLSAYVCCKRALAGAVLAYIGCFIMVKLLNIILVDAMITDKLNRDNTQQGSKRQPDRKGRQQ
jgi:hypothetical protein